MSAADYPVYFPFGATTDPYSPSNPHKGDDRCNAVGVEIVVNGTLIGLTGFTGYVFPKSPAGAHLHVGRYVNGVATNPNGGGFNLTPPVTVTTVAEDSRNGKYVRLTDGDGVQWVYLHMSDNSKVSVGQVLQGGSMSASDAPSDDTFVRLAWNIGLFRDPGQNEIDGIVGQAGAAVLRTIQGSQDWKAEQFTLADYPNQVNATDRDIDILRILATEIQGWDFNDTHAGKNDAALKKNLVGQPLRKVIRDMFANKASSDYRAAKVKAFAGTPTDVKPYDGAQLYLKK